MPDLLRLPFRAADLATRPARFAIRTVWGLIQSDDGDAPAQPREETAVAATPVVEEPAERPAPRAKSGAARSAGGPSPKAARRTVRREPTKGQAAAIREQQREAEFPGDDGPGAEVTIDPAVLELAESSPVRREP